MGLPGNQARIRALFCELILEDQSAAPDFEKVWSGARSGAPERTHAPGRSVGLMTTAVLMFITCLLALWYLNTPNQRPDRNLFSELSASASIRTEPLMPGPNKAVTAGPTRTVKSTHSVHKAAASAQGRNAVIQQAVVISGWQSPTTIFMDSPASSVLKSTPQLNQSARELQAFLPGNQAKELSQ